MPDEALEELFGFVANQCIVYLDGERLDSLKKFNDKFYEFDSWEIYDKEVPYDIGDCCIPFSACSCRYCSSGYLSS